MSSTTITRYDTTTYWADPSSSAYRSQLWRKQADAWTLTFDMWQSALYVREQREVYLEKFRKEKLEKYNERLNRSVFTNDFRNAIETYAGMALKKDPRPDTAPPLIEELYTDIDGCGNSLHQFLIEAFELFLRDGDAHIFIDAPVAPEPGETRPTLADRLDDRPVWVLYAASQLISKRTETVNGREVLTQAVLEEKTLEPDGPYGEKEVIRHRILRPGSFTIEERNDQGTFTVVREGKLLPEIPLVSLGKYGATPPLLVLAMLNQQYYNKISDFDSWCHIACVPRQVLKFDTIDQAKGYKDLAQEADTGLLIAGENANAFYLEPSGKGLDVAAKRNDEIRRQMAEIGVNLLAPTEVMNESATKTLDTAGQRQSKLARFAREFENGIEKAIWVTGLQWNAIRGANAVNLAELEANAIKLNMDFDRLTMSPEQQGVFERMNQNGKLSDRTMLEIISEVVDFPAEWTVDEELRRLNEQRAATPSPKPPTPVDAMPMATGEPKRLTMTTNGEGMTMG